MAEEKKLVIQVRENFNTLCTAILTKVATDDLTLFSTYRQNISSCLERIAKLCPAIERNKGLLSEDDTQELDKMKITLTRWNKEFTEPKLLPWEELKRLFVDFARDLGTIQKGVNKIYASVTLGEQDKVNIVDQLEEVLCNWDPTEDSETSSNSAQEPTPEPKDSFF